MTVCDDELPACSSTQPLETTDSESDSSLSTMLSRLVDRPEAHFRHQTRDEEPLSGDRKLAISLDLYTRRPGVFLERFHRLLQWPEDRQNFLSFIDSDEVVMHFVRKLDRESTNHIGDYSVRQATRSACVARNRRLRAVKLLEQGAQLPGARHLPPDYFSHEAMRRRAPILWEEMVGRHLSAEAKRCYLGQDYSTFSGFLLNQMHERQHNRDVAQTLQDRGVAGCLGDWRQPGYVDPIAGVSEGISIPSLEGQFEEIMKLRFISHQDVDFNYAELDNDDTLDDDIQCTNDAEEAYFDKD